MRWILIPHKDVGKGRNAMTTKEDDYVSQLFVANTHTPLIFFSSKGMCYQLKTYKLPEAAANAKGRPLINLLPLSEGETITAILPVPEDQTKSYLMFATSMGTIRRNNFSDFESIRANGKIAMKLEEDESLVSVMLCNEDQDVFLSTYLGRCIRFPVSEIRVFQSRNSTGVRAIKLGKGDTVISMAILNHSDADTETRAAYIKVVL